ncbi:MAG: glycosyltransferase family 2 protein [Faecalibacterium sp.]|nr:glycosyltransferase family 2 protein [Ruminococcus sp.]MCM1392334.1 glycosyltransferase family 2 protein [Ruminococcus sp.]MCM1486041.1 glycosyltransferase family 2 protein [Faecalibacterium sp.]
MGDYTVSGCIVTYNSKNIIERTIQSVLENTKDVPFELFVVDNCSTDGTAEFIRERFPQVNVIESKSNSGFGAGHNQVIPFLKSKYHVVINPDIILKDDVISELASYADEHEQVGLLSPQILFEDGRVQHLGKRNPTVRYLGDHWFHKGDEPSKNMTEYCMLDMPADKPFEIANATGCFMFFRTDIFKELGGFDERFFMYLEDCDIARRVSEKWQALHYPMVNVYHLWERESKRNKKLLMIHIKSILTYFAKWGLKF